VLDFEWKWSYRKETVSAQFAANALLVGSTRLNVTRVVNGPIVCVVLGSRSHSTVALWTVFDMVASSPGTVRSARTQSSQRLSPALHHPIWKALG